MGSKVFMTYKRKRLFSRSDHSPINLHSDKPSEISESKASAKLNKDEEPTAEHTLQNKDTEFGICHEYSKDKVGETMLQCENCDSQYCDQCSEANKSQRLCSACVKIKQQDSSVSSQTHNFTLEQKACFQESRADKITFHPNETDEIPRERFQIDSSGESNANEKSAISQSKSPFVNLGSKYKDKCNGTFLNEDKCKKTFSISPTPDACSRMDSNVICLKTSDGINSTHEMKDTSISGTCDMKERNKVNEDQSSSLCNNLVTKRKLSSKLITFCRRSKKNKNNASTDNASASCSADPKDEKKPPEEIDNSCSFSAPAAAAATVMHLGNPLHFKHDSAENAVVADAKVSQDSDETSCLEEKVCMDVQDTNVKPYGLLNEDANTGRLSKNLSGTNGSVSALDLSVSPPTSCDIDCNMPLDCGSDENHLSGHSEAPHDFIGSTSKISKNVSSSQVQCLVNGSPVSTVNDKGKFIVESPPVFMGNSSENNCIQHELPLFPENRINDVLQSRIHNFPLQSEQTVNTHAYYSSLYEWPHIQPTEPLHDFPPSTSYRNNSLTRHLTMLDNILTRARAARENKISLLDRFDFSTTWSEEELDCLWVGVRRHGAQNWDAIIRDRRLNFSPWKTSRDLADRWQEEQYRLFYGGPVSQVKHAGHPEFLSCHAANWVRPRAQEQVDEFQLSLGVQNQLHEWGAHLKKPSARYMNLVRNRQFQKSKCSWGLYSPPSEGRKGNLPHWLREAVEIPSRPSGPTSTIVPSVCNPNFDSSGNSQQSWMNTKNAPVQKRTEPPNSPSVIKRGKRGLHERPVNEQDDLIVIPSDASSEETISDDLSIRP